MAYQEFSPFDTKSITISFDCSNCSLQVDSEEIFVPSPNFSAERSSDSVNIEEGFAICESCGQEYEIEVGVSFSDGWINIDGLPEDTDLEIIYNTYESEMDDYEFDAISSNTEYYSTFSESMVLYRRLEKIGTEDISLKTLVFRQVIVGAVTSLETYLCDALATTVIGNNTYLQRFIENNKDFKEKMVSISDVFSIHANIANIARDALLEIIYHNIPKVAKIYDAALGIKFQSFGNVMKVVKMRHDLVHRNGKDKVGLPVELNQAIVDDALAHIDNFVNSVDEQLREL